MEIDFKVSVPSRKQVMHEEGYNSSLDRFIEFEASAEARKLIYDMFCSPSIHEEQRRRFMSLYSARKDIVMRDLCKSPIRYYAMYLENPQWFGHSPETVVACGLSAAMDEVMKGVKGVKHLRFPKKALTLFTERAVDELYYDAKTLMEGKKYMIKYQNGN